MKKFLPYFCSMSNMGLWVLIGFLAFETSGAFQHAMFFCSGVLTVTLVGCVAWSQKAGIM